MKRNFLMQAVVAAVMVISPALVFATTPPDPSNKTQVMNKVYRMQIPFIENKGQVGSDDVSFYAKTFGGTLFVGKDGTLMYSFSAEDKGGVVIKEIVTDSNVTVKGLEPSPTKVNYFKGNDQSKWKTNIPSYNSISLGEVYKGVELTLKAYGKNVEKLFTVLPTADPGAIKVTLQGAKELKVNDKGELEVITDHGPITFTKPLAYQEIDGKRVEVDVTYQILNPSLHHSITPAPHELPTTAKLQSASYGFKVAAYNKVFPLIIDPLLASTYIGGSGSDLGYGITLDGSGNVYIVGFSTSSNYDTTPGAYDTNIGFQDAIISKLNNTLSVLLASTYIGGTEYEEGLSLALDDSGNVYITGVTESSDYPTTAGAYDTTFNGYGPGGGDAFVSKLDNTLSTLLASTYLGGDDDELVYDRGGSLTLDICGNVYVTGYAGPGFPTTTGAYDETYNGNGDAFVSKLDNTLSTLLASTYLGGEGTSPADGRDYGYFITLDESGNVYVTGDAGVDFPTTPGAYDTTYNGGTSDVFVTKLKSDLSGPLLASTFLGGDHRDWGRSLNIDVRGNIYLGGGTEAGSGFPTTPGAYDETYNGGTWDVFVTKFKSDLSNPLLASTLIGGDSTDVGYSLALDESGNAYVTGRADSSDYPTTLGAYDENHSGTNDVFISKIDSTLSALLASTFIGGINGQVGSSLVIDGSGYVYITGYAGSGFPTTPGAYDTGNDGASDVFVSKLDKNLLSDTGFTFKTAYTAGGAFLGSGQFLADLEYLDDPFAYIQCPSSTLTIDFWLTGWSGNNVKAVDYYFTWDTSLFEVEGITSTNPSWTTHTETLNGSVYHLHLESSSGIAGPDIKLHSITLSIKPEAVPGTGRVKSELLPDGYVKDVLTNQYTSVGKTEITIQTICDFPTPTQCTEANPCDSLEEGNICPVDAAITENAYSLTPQGTTLHEGDRVSVYRTKKGSYTAEVAEAVTATCNSGCFDRCMDNCTYVELQDCYIRCIRGCINGLCDGWDTEEKCYEVENRLNCNVSCYDQCANSYNPSTETSYYTKLCGFSINEPITLRNAAATVCTGSIKNTYTMTGAGTAGIGITMPFESGTGSHSYDICSGSTFIQRVTVADGGAKCSLSLLQNSLIANQGSNSSINVTLANQNAGGDYDIVLKRYKDDAHTIELSVPGSLPDPGLKTVGVSSSTSFNINAIDPQPEGGVNNWANTIIKATSGSYTCEAAFDYRVVCPQVDTDFDGTIDCIDNCPTASNPNQEDTFPPGGNFCGNACECEGNFDGNVTVDGLDAATFKADYGRSGIKRPCITIDPCHGDFSCNGNVDGLDAALFKSDFGRSGIKNPCPAHVTDPWCEY